MLPHCPFTHTISISCQDCCIILGMRPPASPLQTVLHPWQSKLPNCSPSELLISFPLRIKSKLFLVTYEALHDQASCYLSRLISCHCGPCFFHSGTTGLLVSQVRGPQGPLHLLFPLPVTFHTQIFLWLPLSPHRGLCSNVTISKLRLASFYLLCCFTFFQSMDHHLTLYYISICSCLSPCLGQASFLFTAPRACRVHRRCWTNK